MQHKVPRCAAFKKRLVAAIHCKIAILWVVFGRFTSTGCTCSTRCPGALLLKSVLLLQFTAKLPFYGLFSAYPQAQAAHAALDAQVRCYQKASACCNYTAKLPFYGLFLADSQAQTAHAALDAQVRCF